MCQSYITELEPCTEKYNHLFIVQSNLLILYLNVDLLTDFVKRCPLKTSASIRNEAVMAVWLVISSCLLADLPIKTGLSSVKSNTTGCSSVTSDAALKTEIRRKLIRFYAYTSNPIVLK